MRGIISGRVVAIILVMMISLTSMGLAYGLWREDIIIIGVVKTGVWDELRIGSYKVVTPVGYDEERSISSHIINDEKTLRLICSNVSRGWHIWVGMLIHNEGTNNVTVDQPIIEIVGANISDFDIGTYFYGPYSKGQFKEVWGRVKMNDLPFNGYREAGEIKLAPSQKAVIWIEFEYKGQQGIVISEATIYITIKHR